ncbi:MAG: metallophosphoesterase [Roseiarcus sp.]|jgi:3',5'-cyclic AMP phosphodiesterase CpdA
MSFTIAHLSDPHLGPAPFPALREMRLKRFMGWVNWKRGRERLNDMAMLARLVADLRAQAPDHVAMTGDVANIGLAEEFRRAAQWLGALGEPADVSFTPGNHDAYVRDAVEPLAETFAPWTSSDAGVGGADRFPFLRVRGEVALIGLNSGVPTGPLMATGRLGARQIAKLGDLLRETGARGLARVILIHHPPLSRGGSPLRRLTDARAFETTVGRFGAEAILHGHTHKRMVHFLSSASSRVEGGRIPVLGAPSASAASPDLGHRAAYHLIRLERVGKLWRVGARARGMLPGGGEIGEREALAI